MCAVASTHFCASIVAAPEHDCIPAPDRSPVEISHSLPLQLKNLLEAIRGFDVGRALTQLHRLRHMWTFDYVNDYIVRRLQTEHIGVPVPKAAWSDDPGCDCAPGCGGAC